MTDTGSPARRLATVAIVVPSYDEGIDYYVNKLRFQLVENIDFGGGKRWVLVSPGEGGARILLAQATTDSEKSWIGQQCGGRVGFFLQTDNFARDHEAYLAAGVTFNEAPRHEPYGTVAVFTDAFGNKWDLIQPAS